MPEKDDDLDALARLDRFAAEEYIRERELARDRQRRDRYFDPTRVPSEAEEGLASRILTALESRIRADVERLAPRFDALVASDEWRRLIRHTRRLERVSCALLPSMTVSLEHCRVWLERERTPPALSGWGRYRWHVSREEIELRWHIPAGWFGCSATYAAFGCFRELATIELRSPDAREVGVLLEVTTSKGKPVWIGRTEARATLALATARLLDLLDRGEIVTLAVDVLAAGREGEDQ